MIYAIVIIGCVLIGIVLLGGISFLANLLCCRDHKKTYPIVPTEKAREIYESIKNNPSGWKHGYLVIEHKETGIQLWLGSQEQWCFLDVYVPVEMHIPIIWKWKIRSQIRKNRDVIWGSDRKIELPTIT